MNTITDIQQNHFELGFNIRYHIMEIVFLTKALNAEYATLMDSDRKGMLDAYRSELESYEQLLKNLEYAIELKEKNFKVFNENIYNPDKTLTDQNHLIFEYIRLTNSLRILKESMFHYFMYPVMPLNRNIS